MLRHQTDDTGFLFSASIGGREIPFSEWSHTDDCIYYEPLSTLVDNGHATLEGCTCVVPFEHIYLLDEDERTLLGVPKLYDKAMRLQSNGMLNSPDFSYRVQLLTHVPTGDLLPYRRKGNLVQIGTSTYLLSEAQYRLILEVEAFNATNSEQKTDTFNLLRFAQIKALAQAAGCALDSYLESENVYTPDKIKVDITSDEEGINVQPALPIEENDEFQKAFRNSRKVPNRYNVPTQSGGRVRVVLTPEQKAGVEVLKAKGGRGKTREEVKELIEHPTEFFDPDAMDLSAFYSDRVVEIGVYQPQFFPFICPYHSCWIAGATVKTPEGGTGKIQIEDEAQLDRLRASIDEAKQAGKQTVAFDGKELGMDDARFLADLAERQLRQPQEPLTTEENSAVNGKKVLIIKENTDSLDFDAQRTELARTDRYTLYANANLNPAFTLMAHQCEGVAWLQHLYLCKAGGCLMADDMGLGKTLQVLYFIDWLAQTRGEHKPCLVVAPISLLENWENEYRRFFLSTMKITRLAAGDVPRRFDRSVVDKLSGKDIILTNYETLRLAQLNLCAVEFEVVVLDEAQKIKTPGTMVTSAAKALKGNFRIALTGTPVENSLVDLWCIMDFCVPGFLGNAKEFAAKYQNPLRKEDVDLVALGNELHDTLGMYFLRRRKADVIDSLPTKQEIKLPVNMPPSQESAYQAIISQYQDGARKMILLVIAAIRDVSEHPFLRSGDLCNRSTDELVQSSARLQATLETIAEVKARGEKAIIFEERKEIQKMLRKACHERFGLWPTIINGDTPSIVRRHADNRFSRQAAIDRFQATPGFNLIIMSPLAAGMGLNVTGANHVVHHSRHWNPAKENQATDRVYRIGQDKDVFIYYPMAVSDNFKSFDLVLDELLDRKKALAQSTIFPTARMEVRPEELEKSLFGSKP